MAPVRPPPWRELYRMKQHSPGSVSPQAWQLPLFLNLWLAVLATLLVLAMSIKLWDASLCLFTVAVLMVLVCPLSLVWVKLASQHCKAKGKPSQPPSLAYISSHLPPPLKSSFKCCGVLVHKKSRMTVVLLRSKENSSCWKVVKTVVCVLVILRVLFLLLLLAGDVERNPGPLSKPTYHSSKSSDSNSKTFYAAEEKKKISGSAVPKQLHSQKHIRMKLTTCVIMGPPGTGKTLVRYSLYNQQPPDIRISTACVEQPQRAILTSQGDDPTTLIWIPVDNSKMTEVVQQVSKVDISDQCLHIVHTINLGGQPQYLDMAPPFLHGLLMVLAVFRLNERLSDTPNVEYYSPDLTYDLGSFDVSNEEMVVRAAQLTLFHKPQLARPYMTSPPTEPVCAVVGTFVDKDDKCDETPVEKNERLETLLKPFSSKLIRRSNDEIIFPIDGTTAGQQVAQPIAVELREAISRVPCFEVDMPLQWQLLHMELGGLGLTVMLRSDVNPIAATLRFESQKAIEAALRYIGLAHFFIYVPEVLPNVVVIEPDAIHKKITQLLEEHIELSASDDADIDSNQKLQFRNQAIFTTEWLYDLPTEYDKAVLSVKDLVLLLQYKLLLAELSAGELSDARYFMPSLLPSQSEGEFVLPKHPPADALVVSFCFQMAPPGLFPAMIVALLVSRCWNLYQVETKSLSPLYKNCIDLTHSGYPGVITLTNDAKEFAIHASSLFPATRLPFTRAEILKALNAVCEKFSFHKLHMMGFRCRCGMSPPHPAVLSSDHTSTTCRKDSKRVESLTAKQMVWVTDNTRDVSTQCTPELFDTVETQNQLDDTESRRDCSIQCVAEFAGKVEIDNKFESSETTRDVSTQCVPEIFDQLEEKSDSGRGCEIGVDAPSSTEIILKKGKELGCGSYGFVSEMCNESGDVVCAGKFFHPVMTRNEQFGEKFRREAEILLKLNDPHIVRYYGSLYPPKYPEHCLLMELMHCTLCQYICERERSIAVKLSILLNIAKGLSFLHDQSVIHRDLTSSNVLLTADDPPVAKIADFGNCRVIDFQTSSQVKTMSRIPGTEFYMPPEAHEGQAKYNTKLDIFSFGHLSLFVFTQTVIINLLRPGIKDTDGKYTHRTAVNRREDYFKMLSFDSSHPVVVMIKECLSEEPEDRPNAYGLKSRLTSATCLVTEGSGIATVVNTLNLGCSEACTGAPDVMEKCAKVHFPENSSSDPNLGWADEKVVLS